MALFEWDSKYSVGIDRWDKQHQRLFELLNELHHGMRSGHSRAVLLPILQELVDYTHRHCAEEERAMEFFSYSGAASHRAEHDWLRTETTKFVEEFEAGGHKISVDLVNLVVGWLTRHVMNTDRQYTDFFLTHDLAKVIREGERES